MQKFHITRDDRIALVIIVGFWLAVIALVNPSGNFPLNDDWNYATTVKSLVTEHRVLVTQWSLAASLTQTLAGAALSFLFGFSHEVLRAYTAACGLLCTLGLYAYCRRAGASSAIAGFAGLIFCGNPLFVNLALSFMTDVPSLMLDVACLLVFAALLQNKERIVWLEWLAPAASVAACLLRQTNLVLPAALAILAIGRARSQRKGTATFSWQQLAAGLIPVVVAVISVVLFQIWEQRTVGTIYAYRAEELYLQQRLAKGPLYLLMDGLLFALRASVYLGIFVAPLLVLLFPHLLAILNKRKTIFCLVLAAEVGLLPGIGLIITRSAMPLADNIFYNFGLGPVLLGLQQSIKLNTAPPWSMVALSFFGAVGAGVLVASLYGILSVDRTNSSGANRSENGNRSHIFLPFLTFCLYMLLICIRGFFDRYLLFPLLLLIPVLTEITQMHAVPPAEAGSNNGRTARLTHAQWIVAVLVFLPMLFFSIAATHDYFVWNRVRWQALDELVQREHISPLDIDGGLEFNGWYGYDPRYRDSGGIVFDTAMRHKVIYAVTVGSPPGFEILGTYRCDPWLPTSPRELAVVRKVSK